MSHDPVIEITGTPGDVLSEILVDLNEKTVDGLVTAMSLMVLHECKMKNVKKSQLCALLDAIGDVVNKHL